MFIAVIYPAGFMDFVCGYSSGQSSKVHVGRQPLPLLILLTTTTKGYWVLFHQCVSKSVKEDHTKMVLRSEFLQSTYGYSAKQSS